jgi:hypothetical protein
MAPLRRRREYGTPYRLLSRLPQEVRARNPLLTYPYRFVVVRRARADESVHHAISAAGSSGSVPMWARTPSGRSTTESATVKGTAAARVHPVDFTLHDLERQLVQTFARDQRSPSPGESARITGQKQSALPRGSGWSR